MIDRMEIADAEKIAERGFKIAHFTYLFMRERYEKSLIGTSPRADFKIRDESLINLWGRAYSWIRTLTKLDQDSDFQAIATASRSLLEIYVDMIILHHDKSDKSADKLFWWYKSEKLKAGELKVKFLENNDYETNENWTKFFIYNEKAEINKNRKRIWGIENKHPNLKRWTGNDLSVDVKEADKFYAQYTKEFLDHTLEHFYETKYRITNWDIHSGISSIHDYAPQKFSLRNFFYFLDCSSFGILCTKLLCVDLGLNKIISNFDELFENVLFERNKLIIDLI